LISVLVQNAAANKGILILRQNDNWAIQATCHEDPESQKIKVLKNESFGKPVQGKKEKCPTNVIEFVVKTGDTVVLENACAKGSFTTDTYIKVNRVKSVLCFPLMSQGKITAVVYLENNCISNAFTEDRLQVIRTLSSQCAISLENGILFNNLQEVNKNLVQFNEACSRFVPTPFIKLLGKSSVVDVNVGTSVSMVCTVLFTDIRSFSTLSEQFTPEETFSFLNALFGQMAPIIRRNNGFIDKFIGDSIMALFPKSPEDAIKTAVDMMKELDGFNVYCKSKWGFDNINIGIGIHTGNLMLGTIGEEGRMDVTVISDAVNLASRLENLTTAFGANILVSNSALLTTHAHRFLGKIIVKGKKQPVLLYEICDGLSDPIRQLKMNTKDEFTAGLDLYSRGEFKRAKAIFDVLLKRNPMDKIIGIYSSSCEHYMTHIPLEEMPKDWSGALVLTKDGRLDLLIL